MRRGKLDVSVAVPVGRASTARGSAATLASVMRIGADDTAPLREFYTQGDAAVPRAAVAPRIRSRTATSATAAFARLRPLAAGVARTAAIADLESLCEEERQLLRQERMHGLLHGWLSSTCRCRSR